MTTPAMSLGPGRRLQSLSIAAALTAGLLLRLWFILNAARIAGDTFIYGDIARNWLDHGIYGFTQVDAPPLPTLIRLPGYPAFLALCFTLFGREHYTAVMIAQAFIDLATCLILAVLSGRLFGRRAFHAALWFSVLCPFTASYVAAPLAETLTLTCIAVALYTFHRWQHLYQAVRPASRWLCLLGLSLAYAVLLRPEQGLLAAAILPAILWTTWRSRPSSEPVRRIAPALIVAALTLSPLVPWTVRNWHTFHIFQPLAPRYATDPGETVPLGFQRWYRTWAIDFTSTEDIYWNYDGALVQLSDIPTRAFDTDAQLIATNALLNDYNQTARANPALDARFAALAAERIHDDPLRYYVALPIARLLNMAFRPRTEMLPIALEWWKFREHPFQSIVATFFGVLNLAYVVLAAIGFRRWRTLTRDGLRWNDQPALAWAMIATIALRSALLLTLDNSEPRYTLEFFPIFIVAIAALFATRRTTRSEPMQQN